MSRRGGNWLGDMAIIAFFLSLPAALFNVWAALALFAISAVAMLAPLFRRRR